MRSDKLTNKFQMALADAQSNAVGRDHQQPPVTRVVDVAHLARIDVGQVDDVAGFAHGDGSTGRAGDGLPAPTYAHRRPSPWIAKS